MKITPYKINTVGDFVKMGKKIEFFDLCEIDLGAFNIQSIGFKKINKSIAIEFEGETEMDGVAFQFTVLVAENMPIGILFQEILEKAIEYFKISEKIRKKQNSHDFL